MWYVEDFNGDVFPLLQGVRDQVMLQRVWYADDKYNLVKKLQNEIQMKITLRIKVSQPNLCPQITSLLTKIIVNPSPLKRHCGQIMDLIVVLMSQSCSNATMGSIRSPPGLLGVFDIVSCCLLYRKESSW